jgi:hypothetical protein
MRQESVGMTNVTNTGCRQVQVPKTIRHVTLWIGAMSLSLFAWTVVVRIIAGLVDR